jgi:hypothetical protein
MYRKILLATGLACLSACPVTASAEGANYQFGMESSGRFPLGVPSSPSYSAPPAPEAFHFTARQVHQILSWGRVGQCVVAANRGASLSYVAARRESAEAVAAVKQLDPAFESCLAKSGVEEPGNRALRRAAVADALGADSRKQS